MINTIHAWTADMSDSNMYCGEEKIPGAHARQKGVRGSITLGGWEGCPERIVFEGLETMREPAVLTAGGAAGAKVLMCQMMASKSSGATGRCQGGGQREQGGRAVLGLGHWEDTGPLQVKWETT